MAHWATIFADDTAFTRTVLVDRGVAGNVVSWEHNGERDVGYWIGREHRGKGVATAALRLFLDEIAARPLHARVATGNAASFRVLEKCGFALQGQADGEILLRLNAAD